jgi:hypothetical protein
LLRASSETDNAGDTDAVTRINVRALADGSVSSGLPHGDALVRFSESVVTGSADELSRSRDALVAEMGEEAMVDAAAVAANFERMVRIADGTGIELGDALETFSEDVRNELGLLRPEGR